MCGRFTVYFYKKFSQNTAISPISLSIEVRTWVELPESGLTSKLYCTVADRTSTRNHYPLVLVEFSLHYQFHCSAFVVYVCYIIIIRFQLALFEEDSFNQREREVVNLFPRSAQKICQKLDFSSYSVEDCYISLGSMIAEESACHIAHYQPLG